jgi:hypothetical protein
VIAPAATTEAERQAVGSARLAKEKIIEKMTFKVMQVPAYVYGRDYFQGDLVDAVYLGHALAPKVAAVVLEQERTGIERIDIPCRV